MGVGVGAEDLTEALVQGGRHRCTGHQHTTQARQAHPLCKAVARHVAPDRRRTEGGGDSLILHEGNDCSGITGSRPGRIDRWDRRGAAEGDIEEGKEREGGHLNFTRLDVEELA